MRRKFSIYSSITEELRMFFYINLLFSQKTEQMEQEKGIYLIFHIPFALL